MSIEITRPSPPIVQTSYTAPQGVAISEQSDPALSTSYASPVEVGVHFGVDDSATQVELYVKNQSGATIYKGQVVWVSGATGANPLISLAQANAEVTSSKTVGFVRDDIPNGSHGYIVVEGIVSGINTSSAVADGDIAWLSPTVPGGFTFTKPHAPYHTVYLGVCLRKQQNNGAIQVHIVNGFELDELHSVSITNPSNGQILSYNSSSGLWVNSTSEIASLNDLPSFSLTFENGLI